MHRQVHKFGTQVLHPFFNHILNHVLLLHVSLCMVRALSIILALCCILSNCHSLHPDIHYDTEEQVPIPQHLIYDPEHPW